MPLEVILHVRVWIEINVVSVDRVSIDVILHVRMRIEIPVAIIWDLVTVCHPPREGVDWNL